MAHQSWCGYTVEDLPLERRLDLVNTTPLASLKQAKPLVLLALFSSPSIIGLGRLDGSRALPFNQTTPPIRRSMTKNWLWNGYRQIYIYNNDTYAYQFSVPPALHGQDVPCTFFNGPNAQVKSDVTAMALQAYITSFAETGVPSGPKLPFFPLYGNSSENQELNATSIAEIMDPTANARCLWWQKGLVY